MGGIVKKTTFCCLQAVLLVLTGAVLISGCASTIKSGREFDTTNVKNIKKGVTKKAEILQMFGHPESKTISSGKESWQYFYQATQGGVDAISIVPVVGVFAGKRNIHTEQSSLSLVFERDVLKECTFGYGSSSYTGRAASTQLESTAPRTQVAEPCGD